MMITAESAAPLQHVSMLALATMLLTMDPRRIPRAMVHRQVENPMIVALRLQTGIPLDHHVGEMTLTDLLHAISPLQQTSAGVHLRLGMTIRLGQAALKDLDHVLDDALKALLLGLLLLPMILLIQVVLAVLRTLAALQAATATQALLEMLAVLETILFAHLVKLSILIGDKC